MARPCSRRSRQCPAARPRGGARSSLPAGRAARAALAAHSLPGRAILPGPRGEPQWPAGDAGSITHCDGYRACAAALLGDVAAIGIDAEPNCPLPDGVLEDVAVPAERSWLADGGLVIAAVTVPG